MGAEERRPTLKLTSWQKVQLSRHPNRPYTRDYLDLLFPNLIELQGDRTFGDDQALVGGLASWPPAGIEHAGSPQEKMSVLILGPRRAAPTEQKMERNFGMAKPEGYRKAMRLMAMAERSKIPVITFIDTPGAYPGSKPKSAGNPKRLPRASLCSNYRSR